MSDQLTEVNMRLASELLKLRDVEKERNSLLKEVTELRLNAKHSHDVWKLVGQLMQLVEYKDGL